MDMSNGITYSEKMEKTLMVPNLLCRDVKARKARYNCSNGSTFTSGQEIRIPITLNNGVIEADSTVFYGTLNIKQPNPAVNIDFSTFSLFDSVRVEAGAGGGATILELCDDIGVFYSFLTFNTASANDLVNDSTLTRGASLIDWFNTGTHGVGNVSKSGAVVAESDGSSDTPIAFALKLSDAMGLFTQNLVLSGTQGISLVLRLAPLASQVSYDVPNPAIPLTLQILQPYVMAKVLEGGEKYERALKEMKSGPNGEISFMFNTYSRYVQNTSGGTNVQLLISDTAKSVLGYFAISRTTTSISNPEHFKNCSSAWVAYQNHAVSIGGQLYPQQPISSDVENYEEVRELFKVISRKNHESSIQNVSQGMTGDTYDAVNAYGPACAIAVNLCKCEDKNVWGRGLNTTGSQSVYLQVSYTPVAQSTVHIFALRQQKVHINAMGEFSVEK
jgi:hypothetical protein